MGSGDATKLFKNFPFIELDLEIYYVMLISLGMPIEHTFELMINEKLPDFSEMLLHHICHIALIFSCLIANFTNIGITILLIHSISELFLHSGKVLHRIGRFSGPAYIVFIMLHFTWFYFRCLCLPAVVNVIHEDLQFPEELAELSLYKPSVLVYLYTLICLHYYWYSMLCKATIEVLQGKELKDR